MYISEIKNTVGMPSQSNIIRHNMGGSKNQCKLQNRRSLPNLLKNTENIYTINTSPSISDFYKNAHVFVTGGTGFVGKALIEKLLRSCEDVNTIYIMIRPKRGLNTDQRLKELMKSTVFDRIRTKCPEYFDKLKVISGDIAQINLGLNDVDKNLLLSNVNIVFHSAATVRFNEHLKDALTLNTLGTQRIIEFCKKMTKLQSFVHVSTAYSNADKREIKEMVYPPPHNPKSLIQCIETLPMDVIADITPKILAKHPNTYTLTKAMAEYVVESANDLPTAIVRPSIVTAAWKEPFPGWVDNVSGITGIMMEISRGTIRSIICDESLIIDVIPVDILVNTLIVSAWHIAFNRSNTVRVYNCTSGQLNGIQWSKFGELTKKYAIVNPTKYVMFYPGFQFRTNRIIHKIYEIFMHMIPAMFFDLLLRTQGSKPIMLKICNKFKRAAQTGEFFSLHEFLFHNNNMKSLICDLKTHTTDFENFECDITNGFEWKPYVESYLLGIRKFVLKDDQDSLAAARKKIHKLYWSYKIVQLFALYVFIRFTFLR